jgi:hypothetical protein
MDTSKTARDAAFRAWAQGKGLRVVRSTSPGSRVGEVAMVQRKGRFGVEVTVELGVAQAEVRAAWEAADAKYPMGGEAHGYEYPVQGATHDAVMAFFGGAL